MKINNIIIPANARYLIFFIFLSFCSISCYDEGPLISFSSATSRVEGTYDVEKFEVGGADSTIAYKSKTCYHPILFRYDKKRNPQGTMSRWENGGGGCNTDGEWSVSGNNIHLEFRGNYPEMGPWGHFGDANWEIKELENKNMTFEIKSNNILYKVTLNEI